VGKQTGIRIPLVVQRALKTEWHRQVRLGSCLSQFPVNSPAKRLLQPFPALGKVPGPAKGLQRTSPTRGENYGTGGNPRATKMCRVDNPIGRALQTFPGKRLTRRGKETLLTLGPLWTQLISTPQGKKRSFGPTENTHSGAGRVLRPFLREKNTLLWAIISTQGEFDALCSTTRGAVVHTVVPPAAFPR